MANPEDLPHLQNALAHSIAQHLFRFRKQELNTPTSAHAFLRRILDDALPGDGIPILTALIEAWMTTPEWWNGAAYIVFAAQREERTSIGIIHADDTVSADPLLCSVPLSEFHQGLIIVDICFKKRMFDANVTLKSERIARFALARHRTDDDPPEYAFLLEGERMSSMESLVRFARTVASTSMTSMPAVRSERPLSLTCRSGIRYSLAPPDRERYATTTPCDPPFETTEPAPPPTIPQGKRRRDD